MAFETAPTCSGYEVSKKGSTTRGSPNPSSLLRPQRRREKPTRRPELCRSKFKVPQRALSHCNASSRNCAESTSSFTLAWRSSPQRKPRATILRPADTTLPRRSPYFTLPPPLPRRADSHSALVPPLRTPSPLTPSNAAAHPTTPSSAPSSPQTGRNRASAHKQQHQQ